MDEVTKSRILALKDTTITDINFSGKDLGDEGAALLAEALTGKQLTRLNLSNCKITNEGFKLLIPIINASPNLSFLDVSHQNVDLSELTINSLQYLNLAVCDVNTAKWAGLNNLINNNPSLNTLILNWNPLTFPMLQDLEQKQRAWEKLSLTNCKLTLDQVKMFIPYEIKKKQSIDVKKNNFLHSEWEEKVLLDAASIQIQKEMALLEAKGSEIRNENTKLQEKISQLETYVKELESKIKTPDHFINDILFKSCKSGNYNLASTALQIGADLQATDPATGQTAFSLSLENGHFAIADMLKEKDANVIHYRNKEGLRPAERGAKSYQQDKLQWMWEAEKKLIKDEQEKKAEYKNLYDLSTDENKIYFAKDKLWDSVKTGDLEGVKEILERNELGIDINMTHPVTKETPIFIAVDLKHNEIVRYLLSKGADYNKKSFEREITDDMTLEQRIAADKRAQSSYERAILNKNSDIIRLFSSHELFRAISNLSTYTMENALNVARDMLGKASIILGEVNFYKQTALHLAAQCSESSFLETLLNTLSPQDDLLETRNAEGKTALHLAAQGKSAKNVELLLAKGACVDSLDNDGQIALHGAVTSYSEDNLYAKDIINHLLKRHAECGSSITIKDKNQNTPMKIAIASGNEELVAFIGENFGTFKTKSATFSCSSILGKHGVFNSTNTQNSEAERTADLSFSS